MTDEDARTLATRRVTEARDAHDAAAAGQALFGGDCVVTGTVTLVQSAPWTADQASLGLEPGELAGWVQDTGRVREPARALDEALLHAQLGAGPALSLVAGQVPAVPLVVDPQDPGSVAAARRWVGRTFPGTLGDQPVVSLVAVQEDGASAGDQVVGLELDAWVEVVPERGGAGAVAANLASPDSRAPNTILLAVPSDVDTPWTQEALFSVVDETLELARCRLVDLDASRRVPAVLPAIYISEYDEGPHWRDLIRERVSYPARYVAKGAL